MRGKPRLSKGLRFEGKTLSVLVGIGIVNQARPGIADANADISVLEDLADFVAHRVVDALDIELRRERRLDAVDDRELGVALFGLLEQALRLVEEAGVFERHAHAVGEGLQQAHVGIRERVLAVHVHEPDQAACLIACDKWNVDGGLLHFRAGYNG